MMITKDSIIRRNANGSIFHHGASMPLGGFTRDAAPAGSKVGGIGEESFGYREYNRTNRPIPQQGKIGGTDPQRADGAIRHVLARWKTGADVKIIEDGDSSFLCLWEPLQPSEGRPESAITADPITRSATSQDARIANTFARLRSHNAKPTSQAKRALANVRNNADALGSINEANREFWSGKK